MRHEPEDWGTVEVEFAEMLGRIRAHHLIALDLYVKKDVPGALVFATRPIVELLPRVNRELWRQPKAAQRLAAALSAAAYAVRNGAREVDVRKSFTTVARATKRATSARVGAAADDPAFTGSVVIALLTTAAAAYEEALNRPGDRAASAYRDARGLVSAADLAYRNLSVAPAAELESAWQELRAAVRTLDVPPDPVGRDSFRASVMAVAKGLESSVGAVAGLAQGPSEIAGRASVLVREAAQAYAAGDEFRAAEIAGRAYIEHYSSIAPLVAEAAPELHEAVNALVGSDIRRAIHDRVPPEELAERAEEAARLLEDVKTRLSK